MRLKSILQIFILLTLAFSVMSASEQREVKKISLKKDEQKEILVKYDSIKKLFKFRWTLYKNGGLVIFRSYDTIVAQNILYLRHKNQSFRLELKSRGVDNYNVPYVLVKFKEFNQETKTADFELYLSDEKQQIVLEYLNEK
ncbi:hypothetical protein SAMN06314019_10913 [Epsilonproteobacteria bacterium SCGC AD-311-C15]|nr:hypothetical protein SAMN06314019_10913 [Epsilonproteobacteria bacterium SCGC AD-311-C15]